MSVRYCTSCTPGRPTVLSRYNPEDRCHACLNEQRIEDLKNPPKIKEGHPLWVHSKESLVEHLQEWAQENGRPPRRRDADQSDVMPHANVFLWHFGSWARALEAAGLPVQRPGRKRTSRERTAVLSCLKSGMDSTSEIAASCGIAESATRRLLTIMCHEGGVSREKTKSSGRHNVWRLVKSAPE